MNLLHRIKAWFTERYVYDECADVRRCHEKFGILTSEYPQHLSFRLLNERVDFLQEELDEFKAAASQQDMTKMLDALLDLVYVAKGTAVMSGLGGPVWEDAWLEVQRSNMEKVRGVGKRGHAVDLVKPAGWLRPQLEQVLDRHGYDPLAWRGPHLRLIPELLIDYPTVRVHGGETVLPWGLGEQVKSITAEAGK